MLYNFYENYANLFENTRTGGFLGVAAADCAVDLAQCQNLAQLFISADMLAYVGIVAMVFMIGARYSSEHHTLTAFLVKISGFFCYLSLFINILGIFSGWEVLTSTSISVFSGLYTFNMSTQLIKVLLLLLTGAMYAFFPRLSSGAFRTLELPLLMQITLALCVTMISAANFALILLALEGFSLTLYIMTALGRTYGGITASVKYFAFGTLGSIFLFWGVVHIYAVIPSLSTDITNYLLSSAHSGGIALNNSLDFATTAIALGFMIKLGAAPTHQ